MATNPNADKILKFSGVIEITGYQDITDIRKTRETNENYRKFIFFGNAVDLENPNNTREYTFKFNANENYQPTWIQKGTKVNLYGTYSAGEFNGSPWEQVDIDTDSIVEAGLSGPENFLKKSKRVSGFGQKE